MEHAKRTKFEDKFAGMARYIRGIVRANLSKPNFFMNELLQSLRDNVKATHELDKEYRFMFVKGKVDNSNQKAWQRLREISMFGNELYTKLTNKLNLIELIDFSFALDNDRKVFSLEFIQSVERHSPEWEEALAAQASNETVQDLITEIFALPLEMKRIIDSERGEYPPYSVKRDPSKPDLFTQMLVKYHKRGKLKDLFKNPDQDK